MPPTAAALASRLLVGARLRQLHLLAKAAELRNLQRAAAAIGLTQPSATHLLGSLERLLECQLFARHARGVEPTAVTVELLPLVRQILDAVDEFAGVAAAVSRDASGVVRVAAITGAINGLLAPLLPLFSRLHPDVLVNLQEVDIAQIGSLLASGTVDIIYCRTPAEMPQGWHFQPLIEDRLMVVCGPSHPLSRRRRLAWDHLWSETWLQGPANSAPRRKLDLLAGERGQAPRYRLLSTRSLPVLTTMLTEERLISLMPASIARPMIEAAQLVALPIRLSLPFEPIGAFHPIQLRGEATRKLRDFVAAASPSTATTGKTGSHPAPS